MSHNCSCSIYMAEKGLLNCVRRGAKSLNCAPYFSSSGNDNKNLRKYIAHLLMTKFCKFHCVARKIEKKKEKLSEIKRFPQRSLTLGLMG